MTLDERDRVNDAADVIKGCECCLEAIRFATASEMDPYRARLAIASIEGILQAQCDVLLALGDPDRAN